MGKNDQKQQQQTQTAPTPDAVTAAGAQPLEIPTEQTPEQIAAEAAKIARAALMAQFGPVQYSHATGTIALYADKRRAGVKNGRAGHILLSPAKGINLQCSVYMDVEAVSDGGKDLNKKTYRFAVPKNVSIVFAGGQAEEKKFKNAHLTEWLKARTVKQTLTDAGADDASVVETEAASS